MARRLRGLVPILVGIAAGTVLVVSAIGALVAMAPDPASRTPPPTATPAPVPSPTPPAPPSTPGEPSGSAAPPGSATPSPPGGSLSPGASLSSAPGSPAPSGSPVASGSVGPSASPEVGLDVGDLAPPLVVDRIGGGSIDLAALRGSPVWVNFLASWCLACRDELPLMSGYAIRLGESGLVVIGVDIKESPEVAAGFVEEMGVVFPVGVDPEGKTRAFWGAYVMPVHFWVDRDGIVRAWAFGGIGPAQMEEGLTTILPGVGFGP